MLIPSTSHLLCQSKATFDELSAHHRNMGMASDKKIPTARPGSDARRPLACIKFPFHGRVERAIVITEGLVKFRKRCPCIVSAFSHHVAWRPLNCCCLTASNLAPEIPRYEVPTPYLRRRYRSFPSECEYPYLTPQTVHGGSRKQIEAVGRLQLASPYRRLFLNHVPRSDGSQMAPL